jgi:hypothetical protein
MILDSTKSKVVNLKSKISINAKFFKRIKNFGIK